MAAKVRDFSKTLPCGRLLPVDAVGSLHDPKALLHKMNEWLERFSMERGFRRSSAREKILETIVLEARHFTALNLLERLGKRHPDVGRATLYRNLPILVESGIIQEGPTDLTGQIRYELSESDHHDHIVCLDCNQIFEFHDDVIEKRQDQVTCELGFLPSAHRHVIYAHCSYERKKDHR